MRIGLVLLLLVAAGVGVSLWLKQKGAEKATEAWPFYAKRPLSNPEQALYFRLVEALPDHLVLAQVQLSRFLGVKQGHDHQAWMNRINRMSADFVVCAKDASVLAVIELDDASHERAVRQSADARKESALKAAGIRLIRWRATALPDVATIKSTLLANPPSRLGLPTKAPAS